MKKLRITALLAAIAFAGCGEPPKDVPQVALHPFTGIVNVNGKPAGGAMVSLHAAGKPELGVVTPHGVTDETGKFSLTTYQPDDGAPEGKYQVTVSWADKLSQSSSDAETVRRNFLGDIRILRRQVLNWKSNQDSAKPS